MKGHIRERSPGHWAIVLDVRDPATGRRRRKWHSFAGTKRQAQIERSRLIAEMAGGRYVEPAKTTVAIFLDRGLSTSERKSARSLLSVIRKSADTTSLPYSAPFCFQSYVLNKFPARMQRPSLAADVMVRLWRPGLYIICTVSCGRHCSRQSIGKRWRATRRTQSSPQRSTLKQLQRSLLIRPPNCSTSSSTAGSTGRA